jgi:restriction system protein
MSNYSRTIKHEGLGKSRVITGNNPVIVDEKAEAQMWEWEEMWDRQQEREDLRQEREDAKAEKQSQREKAQSRTKDALDAITEIETLLKKSLKATSTIDWESLKDYSPFSKPQPLREVPFPPIPINFPPEPKPSNNTFRTNLGFWDRIFPSRVRAKESEAKAKEEEYRTRFESKLTEWRNECEKIVAQNATQEETYRADIAAAETVYQEQLSTWKLEEEAFEKKRAKRHSNIDRRKAEYYSCNPEAVVDYCDLVLTRSQYPKKFPKEFGVDYVAQTKTAVIDYRLPTPADLPIIKEVRYIAQSDEFKESILSETERNRLYDSVIYQVILRTIREIFDSDTVSVIDSIVFNGWVQFIDKSVGREIKSCIVSLQTTKGVFNEINLASVEPKACFKALKGVGSAKLYGLTPVAPIFQISKEDKRFVSSYAVAHTLDDSVNIAAMDWEDFEHLVRELFEKEFSSTGGEVKITQASRDGGVDGIAFDPDPIRGGKIVIQAKRYTNTVGVAAVRDLYGTVINEGATKGILITTSDYGPDAFDFAKGKPLTLLSGANLLHLLSKHGYRAKINIAEAREQLSQQKGRNEGDSN